MRDQGRDLHADFLRLLPERPPPIAIQRWSIRRIGLMIGVALLALLALLTALSSFGAAGLLRGAACWWPACLVLAGCRARRQATRFPRATSRPAPTRGARGRPWSSSWPRRCRRPASACVELKPPGWTVSDVFVRNKAGALHPRLRPGRRPRGHGGAGAVLRHRPVPRVPSDHPGPAATRRSSRSSPASATRARSTTCSPAAASPTARLPQRRAGPWGRSAGPRLRDQGRPARDGRRLHRRPGPARPAPRGRREPRSPRS